MTTLQELKMKEFNKLILNVPPSDLPNVFKACQDVGLVGEGVQFVLSSLDFHGTQNYSYSGFNFANVTSQQSSKLKVVSKRELPDRIPNDWT